MADLLERVSALEQKLAAVDGRVSTLEGQFDFIARQLRELHLFAHGKFDQIDRRFDRLEGRFDKLEGRFDKLEATVEAMPRAIIEALRPQKK